MYWRAAAVASLVAGDAAVLLAARPDWPAVRAGFVRPRAWIARAGTDAALASLAEAGLWLVAAWLAVGLLAAAASALPGAAGRAAAVVSRLVLPAVLRRVIAGSAGLGVLVAPVAANADAPGAPPHRPSAVVALPAPTWPVDPPAAAAPPNSGPSHPAAVAPQPRHSGAADRPADATLPPPGWPVDRPAPQPSSPSGTAQAAPRRASPRAEVRVRPGDSLWLIAARHLGPDATEAQVATAWPQWYAANRRIVGPDPGMIVPGEVLHVPDEAGR